MIPEHIKNRKGARSLKDLNPEVIEYLNKGLIETRNLMEWLATDQLVLLKLVLKDLGKEKWYSDFEVAVNAQKKPTANSNTKVIGQTLGLLTSDKSIYDKLKSHTSDLVRCWSCWAESTHFDSINNLIHAMKPYAADSHFGVREVVIFASKERMIEDLDASIDILSKWTKNKDENIRRFAVESLRPIGVWTKKIPAFQEHPEKGLSLLEPLNSDASKYVRDSVGNWLNDASKSQPNWVKSICLKWENESPTKETAYIIKKGLRTINK
ncbi:DNA alkylation repair protein [Winogradskyella haliclonae]|uniref:DNA alkylation repair protein n=1 Tax=Winogradskyella haliclonae TaxID=2048558 RepID=A0ABQ2C124_9FLAO|nr:DNA alkylation repair protein [Winogradskyella haliclonae]GGI58435.1 DNA alkylation repair protein [Winogradskyella haliclonae]